jgi:aconitase A
LHEPKKKIKEIKDNNERKKKLKELSDDLRNLKLDLYTNSILVKYDGQHKDWLKKNRDKLVPIFENDNINYHLKKDPLSCLKYSIYINTKIEELGSKPYQIVPQRNNYVPKHIMIDHSVIVDMLGNELIEKMDTYKKKAEVMLHPKEYQEEVFTPLLI